MDINSDISAAGAIHSTSEEFSASMMGMKTGIAFYDKDFKLKFANGAIRNFLPTLYASLDAGQSMKDALIAQTRDIYPDDSSEELEIRAGKILKAIKNLGGMEVTTPKGNRLKSHYDRTPEGGYIITTMDITDRVKNEESLAKARMEADSANKAKTEFLANMSHEIRTPLSGVFMSAQILLNRLRATQQSELSELADILVSSAGHLSGVINNILDLSKIEAGQIDIVLTENAISDNLRAIVKSQHAVAKEKGVELKLVIAPDMPKSLMFDHVRVRQCVTNLVNNALKFTRSGSVTIAALFERNVITIHVIDTGPGIAPENQNRVFDNFAQSPKDKSHNQGGTGLGLPISRKLARLMGGDLKLTSLPGKGSVFTLTFAGEPAGQGTQTAGVNGRLQDVA